MKFRCGFPLKKISLSTIIKVADCNVFHNDGNNPSIQISVGGFALSSLGDVVYADIQFGADCGDYEKVSKLIDTYTPGSLHWIESDTFGFIGGNFQFYDPQNICPVDMKDIDAINIYFPAQVDSGREPQKGEFGYGNNVYVAGIGGLAHKANP